MNIGNYIHYRRKELGLTLEDVGKAVGVGKSTVKKWESGDIANMRRDKIALLSKILQTSPIVFINEDIDLDSAMHYRKTGCSPPSLARNSLTSSSSIVCAVFLPMSFRRSIRLFKD